MSRTVARVLGGAVATGAILLAAASPALAHVTVNPNTAVQGGFTKLSFRIPTEKDNASTNKIQVFFPTDQPLASVAVKPHPGWHYQVAESKLATPISSDDGQVTEAVSQITWTADSPATAIKPGQFDEFDVSVGPLPKASRMTFKALQTYSDGSVVRWIQTSTPGGAEPEHPAPVLTLTATATATATAPAPAATTAAAPKAAAPVATKSDAASTSSVNRATVLAVLALLVGLVAGALGAMGLRRRRFVPAIGSDHERIEQSTP